LGKGPILAILQIFSAVLRIGDVEMPRAALEAALGVGLDRYEPARTGTTHYAQIVLPIEKDVWGAILDRVQALGPKISSLRQECMIGSACIDFAFAQTEHQYSFSIVVPSYAAEAISRHGVDIEFSVYPSSEPE